MIPFDEQLCTAFHMWRFAVSKMQGAETNSDLVLCCRTAQFWNAHYVMIAALKVKEWERQHGQSSID